MEEQKNLPKGKVLIIVENLPVPNDRRVWLEATTLRDAGYRVSVISIKGENAMASREVLEGIHVYRYPPPPSTRGAVSFICEFLYCWLATLVLSIIVAYREGFDILHACNPPETFWLIGLLYKPFRKKFLFDHHDLSPEMYYSRFGRKGLTYRFLLLLERLTFMTADAVITTNDTHRRIALERGKVSPERIFVVRSGPDHRVLAPGPPEEALKQGRRYMVSYLGVLNPQDGVDLFVKAVDHIVHQIGRDDVQFVIMGSGDAEQDLRALSRELAVDQHVHFTSWASMDTILRYLCTSDVCVDTMPKTPYSEAATLNKILEYMAAGRAVATFDLPETRISAQEAALYARPDDVPDLAAKIVSLLADQDLRAQMGQAGRRRIETELAWEHQQAELLAAYEFVSSPANKQRGPRESPGIPHP
jgi:glycosyltransferase involved in cell wall biosynthesis